MIAGGDQRLAKAPPEVSKDWKLEPLRDDVRRMISSGPIHIVMAGDLDVEQAVKTVASTFGALPPRPPYNPPAPGADQHRKSVVKGKSGSVRVDTGGGRILKKKTNTQHRDKSENT